MTVAQDALVALLLLVGAFFYLAGTIGLLRFPDALSRMHALTKADNLGLLCICAAAAILAGALRPALLLLLIWLLAIFSATVSAHLIGRLALTDRAEAISPGRENDR